jgi:hypothetical protein
MMDYLRYYLCSLTVGVAIIGFMLGGQWMWLGLATFSVFRGLDLVLGNRGVGSQNPPSRYLHKILEPCCERVL